MTTAHPSDWDSILRQPAESVPFRRNTFRKIGNMTETECQARFQRWEAFAERRLAKELKIREAASGRP